MDAALEARMTVLLDKEEIHDLIMRYCRGVDRCDRDLIASTYYPDAIDEHGTTKTLGRDCADYFISRLTANTKASMHLIGNELIEINGNIAFAEFYFISYHVFERDGREYTRTQGARYVDRLEKRSGEWKIAHRFVVHDWNRLDAVVEPAAEAQMIFGKRSKEDIVYQIQQSPGT